VSESEREKRRKPPEQVSYVTRWMTRERDRLGWGQAELAEKIGETQARVAKWEMGISEPGVADLGKLFEAFGTTDEEIRAFFKNAE
jgi:transcriptional regulator with XRE-family HTH domain